MAIDPYIKKDPNDLIRSGDWNDIQVRARQEIRSHTHQGDADGTPIPRAGIMPNAIDGTRIDPASKVTVAQLKVVDRDLLADINTLITRANDFDSRINALTSRATALENTRVNRAGDTITGALRVNGGLQLGGEGSTLELGAGATKDPDGGKIAFRAFSQGLDIVGAGTAVTDRKITFHAQGGATFLGGASFSGSVQYTGRLSKLETDEQGSATVRASDFLLGHSARRGTRVPASPPGRALVDATDTLVVNYGADWPKAQITGTDLVLLSANEVSLAGQVRYSNGQLRNASGFAVFQTNATDWLRINMDQSFPAIALYKPVAIGTGGLAVGTWHQLPAGQLRVADSASIGNGLTMEGGAITPTVGNSASAGIQFPLNPGGGSGDEAFIRYFAVSGEKTMLRIGINNDPDDVITLHQAGVDRLTVRNNGVHLSGNIGTSGYDAYVGLPPNWGGGVHTWDIACRATGRAVNGWQTGGWDLAEKFDKHDPTLEPGDVVVADPSTPERLIRSSAPYERTLLGVISEKPGFLLGVAWEDPINPVALGLAGRVPVKVTLEGGPIRIGDPLTSSSTPGHAMRAMRSGRVIGVALEDFDGSPGKTGKIVVFLNPHWLEAR